MGVRLQFDPRREPPDLLDLPWSQPLATWDHPRLVRMARGQSRHVVRFVSDGERAYALKEMPEREVQREYGMLRQLATERLPVVEPVGLVTGRETPEREPLDGVLATRYLDYSLPFTYLFGVEGGGLARRLVDAAVVLLARLHLEGFYWGDCSLSNLLFRRDAGALMAYMVDAETTEHHDPLSSGLRQADLELARENIAGGLFDMQAAGRLLDLDVLAVVDRLEKRYRLLWDELTAVEEIDINERTLIDRRIRRLNELGFDVAELVVERDAGTSRIRVRPAVVEEGHHAHELRRLTGWRSRKTRPVACSTTSSLTAPIWQGSKASRCPRPSWRPGGWPRSMSRSSKKYPTSCDAGSSPRNCSTNSSSIAITCRRRSATRSTTRPR